MFRIPDVVVPCRFNLVSELAHASERKAGRITGACRLAFWHLALEFVDCPQIIVGALLQQVGIYTLFRVSIVRLANQVDGSFNPVPLRATNRVKAVCSKHTADAQGGS